MSQVDQVRSAADIVKIVGDYVKLRKAGANFMGLCPFHQEKTPSFAVHPAKQIFHCFGCGVGGDVFKFVMMIDNLSFPEALRRVGEKVGITIRDRLRVLLPADPDDYYRQFDVVPPDLRDNLNRAKVIVTNFHQMICRETVSSSKRTKQILAPGRESPIKEPVS